MQFIRGLKQWPPAFSGCVATIGSFDGVHVGHQALIGQLIEHSQRLGVPSVVMSFEPQPKDYFQPNDCLPRLTRLREKIQCLTLTGVDAFLLLRFDQALASLTAEAFVTRILVRALGVRHVVVGDDFCFGKGRKGDFDCLVSFGKQFGFGVSRTQSHQLGGVRASSTAIRQALVDGQLDWAAQLLGRAYTLSGKIVRGQQKGRTIGFPTANLPLFRQQSPVRGVFVVEMLGIDEQPLPGVANIGNRPTLAGDGQWVLEVHLFDFNRNIYGRHVQVRFLHKIREEKRFESFHALKDQIEQDAAVAKQFFNVKNHG